jgi:hypothetical protein
MKDAIKHLSYEIQEMESKLVDYIVSKIEDLSLDVNITETKVTSQGKFKKYIEEHPRLQIKYEIHYLEESLSIDPIDKKILYRNDKIGYNIIEISNIHYIKLRMTVVNRKNYFDMVDKRNMLDQILK